MDLLDCLKKCTSTLIPAAGDGETFMQLTNTNVPAIFLSGALTAKNIIAEESEGLLSITEYAQFAHHMRIKKKMPLILDLQSGFGNPLNTYYAAKKLESSGGDVLVLNDQTYPSHTIEKPAITTTEDFIGKIRASLDSFENPTTQLWIKLEGLHEYGVEGFQKRVRYAANAGAHAVITAHCSLEDLQTLSTARLALPLLATMNKKTPKANIPVVAWLDEGLLLQEANKAKQQWINERL